MRRWYRRLFLRLGDRFYPTVNGVTRIRRGGVLYWLYERLPKPW